jgi:hypothetical protein
VYAHQILEDPTALQSDVKTDGTFKLQFYNASGTAANVASGTQVLLKVVLRKTSVGPWDA